MPKEKSKKGVMRGAGPLEVQMKEDVTVESHAKAKADRRRKFMGGRGEEEGSDDGDDFEAGPGEEDDTYIPAKISKKILNEARLQQQEDGVDAEDGHKGGSKKKVSFGTASAKAPTRFLKGGADAGDEEEEEEEIIEFGDEDGVRLDEGYVTAGGFDMGEDQLAAEEEILKRFMSDVPAERKTLADIILEKIKENEERQAATAESAAPSLDPKIVEVYTEVGRYLSHYKSGKLPKVFKIIPGLSNWEEILFLTNPETWTPHATYAATRIFASSFNPTKAQRFFNIILLPKCRDDIYFNKRMNFHLYLALKKATYKPAAFYKGIILPLAAEPDATLREAIIFGSVIAKVSIPQIHSAAAIYKLSQLRYNGAISVLLKILINKKYTLPYKVVDVLVEHFEQFRHMSGALPIIWHQCLLCFAQRYKGDLTGEQKDILRELLHIHNHHLITPEIRRELFSVGCRGDAPTIMPAPPRAAPAAAKPVAKPGEMMIDY